MYRVFNKRYIYGYRLHHGASGLAVLLYGLARRNKHAMIVGAILILDDIADIPFHWSDEYQPWWPYSWKPGVARLFVK